MRRRRLRRYVDRLQALTRDQLLMKLGAAKHEAGRAANLIELTVPKAGTPICPPPMGARSCCRDTLSPRPITACCSICFA